MTRILLLLLFTLGICGVTYAARQALVPGAMQINETTSQEALVPGFVQVNETVSAPAATTRRIISVQ